MPLIQGGLLTLSNRSVSIVPILLYLQIPFLLNRIGSFGMPGRPFRRCGLVLVVQVVSDRLRHLCLVELPEGLVHLLLNGGPLLSERVF